VEGEDANVREAAIHKLTDQGLLARLAAESNICVRIAAVQTITDQTLLAKFAESRDIDVRVTAVEKLTNQAVLPKVVAMNDDDVDPPGYEFAPRPNSVREAAVQRQRVCGTAIP
jgi:hypothetical protein